MVGDTTNRSKIRDPFFVFLHSATIFVLEQTSLSHHEEPVFCYPRNHCCFCLDCGGVLANKLGRGCLLVLVCPKHSKKNYKMSQISMRCTSLAKSSLSMVPLEDSWIQTLLWKTMIFLPTSTTTSLTTTRAGRAAAALVATKFSFHREVQAFAVDDLPVSGGLLDRVRISISRN